ncbi:hypothetical protein [Methylobacterium oxalidis]|uniref:hypothetical protein n=1 Tax=Methylobacterium oxalidis TaxID=944322 RepID=UPI0014787DAB|nr:hypothetical protein [Methylobacterium oxalidis]
MAAGLGELQPDLVEVGMLAETLAQAFDRVDAASPARHAFHDETPTSDVAEALCHYELSCPRT